MVAPHHQNNRNNRDHQNRGRSRTARPQMGGSQNNGTAPTEQELAAALERQRQAQRDLARLQNRAASFGGGQVRGGGHGSQSQSRSHRTPSVARNRNTSVANGRNPSAFRRAARPTGVTKPQQAPSSGLSFPIVPEAERRDFVNPRHGTGGMDVVNKTLTGGEQNRFGAPTHTGGFMGRTYDAGDLQAVGEHVFAATGCESVAYHVEPRRHDAKKFMENEEVLVRVTSSNGRTKQGKVSTLGEPSRFTEISHESGIRCVNCRLKTHTLRHCLDAENEPDIYGCILCNNENHTVDQCAQFKSMSLKEQVELLVFERANMPCLAVSKDFPKWYDLLEQAISSGDIDANGPMKGFPWTGQFCLDLCREQRGDTIRALQKEFDESRFDTSILRVDPDTDSLHQVRLFYGNQPQAPRAPGPSSSGGHIHQDDPRDLRHAAEGRFGPLTPKPTQPASWAQSGNIQDSDAGRGIFDRM